MTQKKIDRRTFIVSSGLAGGGLVLGLGWLQSCKTETKAEQLVLPEEWYNMNAYLKIGDNGVVTIYTPNPEFGQNIKTSMPMLVAEELDCDWDDVIVEQAPYHEKDFGMQFTGGSRGITTRWDVLRQVGASARHMLREAAANAWEVPIGEVTTAAGVLYHKASGKSASYGEFASAAAKLPVPENVEVEDYKEFDIIGKSRKNVDGPKIVNGELEFGLDYYTEGMLFATVVQPPAFGMTLDQFDTSSLKNLLGITDVFPVRTYKKGFVKNGFDVDAFPEVLAIVGDSTWQVLQAKRQVEAKWKEFSTYQEQISGWDGSVKTKAIPAGLESTGKHKEQMANAASRAGKIVRKDGKPEEAFQKATKILERSYSCPYLAHNCMEVLNAFAHVEGEQIKIVAPVQAPGIIIPAVADALGIPKENIEMDVARMGGGFGRKAYEHYVVEAAIISQKVQQPVKLMYTREDDMTNGIYRPTYQATYKAAINEQGEVTAIHIKAGGIPESPLFANRFPAGAVDNYLAEEWSVDSNITIGAFRAPRSNFMAGAEQSFLDELAEELGKDPIAFRLELLQRAEENPVGENNDYDAARYAGVLQLVKEKSNWNEGNDKRGVAAYFCHKSYAAHVMDVTVHEGKPRIEKVWSAVDCGIVVNPDAATNMVEGGIVDAIGCAMYGEMEFENGQPTKNNFHNYRMIKMNEAPKEIEVHFVENGIRPTGLGEPPFPPTFGALANALYQATGKRFYDQPFLGDNQSL